MSALPDVNAEGGRVYSGASAPTRFAHDFSGIPVHSTADQLQTMRVQENDFRETVAPPIVHDVLRSSGQPLDTSTRGFMEPRFGHDFSHVRVHTDGRAVKSASALGARAYTVGADIVFGQSQYAPETKQGEHLLAHELAHVVQQQSTRRVPQAELELGDPADSTEHEADAVAHATLATDHLSTDSALRSIPRISTPSALQPVIRRTPEETWAGSFDTEWYKIAPPVLDTKNKIGRYGADIKIVFTPNKRVSADKIALVQTAQSLIDNVAVSLYSREKNDVTLGRSTPGAGIHIDQSPKSRTPLTAMLDPTSGSDLADSGPSTFTQSGSQTQDKTMVPQQAWLRDTPGLKVGDQSEALQEFETTALAVAGPQTGAFYGSVRWGWKKEAGKLTATTTGFQRVSKDAPGSEFADAAELWNASKTSENKDTIALPLVAGMYTNINKGKLMDDPKTLKSLGNLDLNTRLEVTDQADPTKGDWQKVVVVDGPLAGKVGWVKKSMLSDRQTEAKRKK
jgi:hypothetical protein